MGSSYHSALNRGRMPSWEKALRDAASLLRQVREEVFDTLEDADQFDNSMDDGALVGRLSVAIEIIEGELPKSGS